MKRYFSIIIVMFLLSVGIGNLLGQEKKPIDPLIQGCAEGSFFDRFTAHCEPAVETWEVNGRSIPELSTLLHRHRKELHAIKGVTASGIDVHEPWVEVEPDHDAVPDAIEGIPLHVYPSITAVGAS